MSNPLSQMISLTSQALHLIFRVKMCFRSFSRFHLLILTRTPMTALNRCKKSRRICLENLILRLETNNLKILIAFYNIYIFIYTYLYHRLQKRGLKYFLQKMKRTNPIFCKSRVVKDICMKRIYLR
jgi:hypothetical protein